MIEIRIEDTEVRGLLKKISGRAKNPSPVMRAISGIMYDSVMEQFEKEGNPKWDKLKPSTIEQRKREGKWPGKMLDKTQGGLKHANEPGHNNTSAWVANNKEYAAAHQFGTRPYTIRPKNKPYLAFPVGDKKWIRTKEVHHPGLPPRPFMRLTPRHLEKIKGKLANYVVQGTV